MSIQKGFVSAVIFFDLPRCSIDEKGKQSLCRKSGKFSSKVVEKKCCIFQKVDRWRRRSNFFFRPSNAAVQENGSQYKSFFVKSGLLKTLYFAMNSSNSRIDLQANQSSFLSILVLWDGPEERYCDLMKTTRVVEGALLIDEFSDVLSR